MKKLMLGWMVLMIALTGLIGCSSDNNDDDDDNGGTTNGIVGNWVLVSVNGESVEGLVNVSVTFGSDGRYTITQTGVDQLGGAITGSYQYSGTSIVMTEDSGAQYQANVNLAGNTVTVSFVESGQSIVTVFRRN